MPGADTEALLYLSGPSHGLALCDVPVTGDGEAARKILEIECAADGSYSRLSAVQLEHWPLLVMACRHSRLPLPPQLWLPVIAKETTNTDADAWQPTDEAVRAHWAFWYSRRAGANL